MLNKRTPLYVYVIIVAILSIIIWGQTRDEALLPVVKQQFSLIIPKTTIAPEQNAFVAMAGFNVLSPEQMVTEGQKAIQLTINNTEKTPFEYNMSFDIPKGQEISALYQLPCDSKFINQHCLNEITAQSQQIRQLIKEQQGFINNYLALQQYSSFAHILPANINSSVPYTYISSVAQLLIANAVLDIQSGQIEQGMQFLLNDIKFYRHMLSSQQKNLEDTTTFTNMLMQHYFVLDRLIHTGIDLKPYLTELDSLTAPLSKQERSLVWMLENERNYHLVTAASLAHVAFYTGDSEIGGCYNDSCSFDRYFTRLFYKYNGTLNAIYTDWQPTIDFAEADYPFNNGYLDKLQRLQSIEKNHHTMTAARFYERYGLFLVKNYAGEKQKNTIYYTEGYSMWFIKLYTLNSTIENLNTIIHKIY